jgi:hypothetical protein
VLARQIAHLREDFRKARRRMRPREPIAPIGDHFAKASPQYQSAVADVTMAEFVRRWREVRRERRRRWHRRRTR